ncbi:hypothetical protein O1L60_27970 [Streptomyces diastatochromogenes]|nr:hypothetical protein [Streptomyces diastatochromogenes]
MTYHRHNEHYRPAHRWAALLLTGGGLEGLFTPGPLASHAFLIDMNRLFEAFVTRLLEDGARGSGLRAEGQTSRSGVLFDERAGKSYGTVRPDVLVSGVRSGRPYRLPVDVKYKLYGEKKLSPEDLYQASLYAHALGRRADGGRPTASWSTRAAPARAAIGWRCGRWRGGDGPGAGGAAGSAGGAGGAGRAGPRSVPTRLFREVTE